MNVYNVETVYVSKNCLFIKVSNIFVIVGIIYVSPLEELNMILNELEIVINKLREKFFDYKIMVEGDFNARIGEKTVI